MHMADALLSPQIGGMFWAGAAGAMAYAARKLRENLDDKLVPLMGVLGAFIFAAQMINFTIPATGSSGHLGGGMILAILLGPYAAFIAMASVLTVQALFFADGGLLALGCNIWNLGIYPCFIAYPLIYKPLTRSNNSNRRILFASFLSAVAGLQMGAFSVVIQTLLSGKSELPFGTFLLLMQPVHLAIGIVEGIVTAGVISYARHAQPEILESIPELRPLAAGISLKKVFLVFALLAVIAGSALSWFASANPDGLEWSIEKTFGKPELPEQEHGIASALKKIQESTAFLPDYSFKKPEGALESAGAGKGEPSWPAIETGTSLSGIIGALIVLGLIIVIGIGIRAIRGGKSRTS